MKEALPCWTRLSLNFEIIIISSIISITGLSMVPVFRTVSHNGWAAFNLIGNCRLVSRSPRIWLSFTLNTRPKTPKSHRLRRNSITFRVSFELLMLQSRKNDYKLASKNNFIKSRKPSISCGASARISTKARLPASITGVTELIISRLLCSS